VPENLKGAAKLNSMLAFKERVVEAVHDLNGSERPSSRVTTALLQGAYQSARASARDLRNLKAIQPVSEKVAVAHELRKTTLERMASVPARQIPSAALGLIPKAGIQATQGALRASDIALAKLFQEKQLNGVVSRETLHAALAAGVAPQLVQHFFPQQPQQAAPK
jgi:division protein CdvB (Snf7/Vps24/ESCRT-III family)